MNNLVIKLTLFFTIMLYLTGCATPFENNQVVLAKGLAYTITAPPVSLLNKTENSLLLIKVGKQKHQFITQLEYSNNKIIMAAMSAAGLPLFDFTWSHGEVNNVNKYVPLPNIRINNIIADIQLCHWPLTQVKSSLHGDAIQVIQNENLPNKNIIWQRKFFQHGKTIIIINKLKNGFQLHNMLHNYDITLTNLSQETL